MQSFKSAVFTAFAALFLAVSLSGCLSEEKTASQGGEVESSMFDSGKVKLVLKPGVKYLQLYFENKDSRDKQGEAVVKLLEEKGVIVERAGTKLSASGGYYKISIRVPRNITVNISALGLDGVVVESALGMVASWDPMQGNEVRYDG